jgi:NAD(P)-dependent dehydrogenase (short-subunit alcohol dehydrogenase family)
MVWKFLKFFNSVDSVKKLFSSLIILGAKAVYVTDCRDDLLPQLAKEIQNKYPKVVVIPRKVDAASEDDVKSVIDDAIKKFGRLDVFFANAG